MRSVIFSRTTADSWQKAFPLGNGRIGAMCRGSFPHDCVEISDITFFSGCPSENNEQEGAVGAFIRMRELLRRGEYEKAVEESKRFIGRRENYGTNLPLGKLLLDYVGAGELRGYERSLDMERGVMNARYDAEAFGLDFECFASNPDHGVFIKLEERFGGVFGVDIRFETYPKAASVEYSSGGLRFRAQALETLHSDGKTGAVLNGSLGVSSDGTQIALNDRAAIRNAHSAYIMLRTDGECEAITGGEYEAARKRHVDDVSAHMSRVTLELGGAEDGKTPIEERISRVRNGEKDDRLTELLFQYGRYLLFCSSRADSPLPAHLQGVWNDNVACRIGWTCDMHLDVNTQMNYWAACAGNLTECMTPLFSWMTGTVMPSGRRTARKSYGQSGWSADIVSNAWGYTAPYWASEISPCPTGGIWQASAFADCYRYTRDAEFLENMCFPVISEAVDFFEGYVFEDGDMLGCGPSVSPENAFLVGGKKYFFSNDTTYETLMIRELFDEYLELCGEMEAICALPEKDAARKAKISGYAQRLKPYRILDDGTIAEWAHDFPAADPQHRHTSHLLGLYPYRQITPEKTPGLAAAAKKTMEKKLLPEDGWEDTGWARSLMLLYSARLKEREMAYKNLLSMEQKLLNPNLMVMHPPTRGAQSFMEVYELDGNTGFTAGVMEMLLQCDKDEIELLPCLPDAWQNGSVSGLLAYGGIEVSAAWEKGRLEYAEFTSSRDSRVNVRYADLRRELKLHAGQRVRLGADFHLFDS